MEIMSMSMSLQINPKVAKIMLPISCKTISVQKLDCYKLKFISCRAKNNLAMQKEKSNFYEVLSLGSSSETVGLEEIKRAYRRMALQYHPDVCPSSAKEESTKRFVELQKAYETLSDPVSRKMYDYEMGFVDGFGSVCVEERKAKFPKEVWEKQLHGLKQRSRIRMERKRRSKM